MDPTRIIISVLTILIALGVGLYSRHWVVSRLKKTVLDNWLIQVVGILAIIPPVIIGLVIIHQIIDSSSKQVEAIWLQVLGWLHVDSVAGLIGNLFWSALIILLAIGVGRTLVKLANRGTAKGRPDINIRILLGRISFAVTAVVAFFWILSIWNIALVVPATVISVITVGIAFVIQDLLKNVVAGIYILIEGPFKIGDQISTDQYSGIVEAVELRATKLRIVSGEQVIVPNSMLFSGIVINKSIYEENRVTITITMQQEEFEKDQTTESILKTIKEVNGVMAKPEPTVRLVGAAGSFGGVTGAVSGYTGRILTLSLRFWIPEGQLSIITDAMVALRTVLPTADLSITEPSEL